MLRRADGRLLDVLVFVLVMVAIATGILLAARCPTGAGDVQDVPGDVRPLYPRPPDASAG